MAGCMPIPEAARAIGCKPGTLRRWIREGCPATHGRRGRGHAAQVDPDQVRAWLGADARDRALREIAAALPDLIARAVVESWQQAEGVDKRRLAGLLCATWYVTAGRVSDYLRDMNPDIPRLSSTPDEIVRLRKIALND